MKKTILDRILDFVAPNYCYNCQKIGSILCSDCKKHNTMNIKIEHNPVNKLVSKELYLSQRQGVMQNILDDFKYASKKQNSYAITDIIYDSLSSSNIDVKNCVIIPVPTAPARIRARGFDHTDILAEQLSYKLNINKENILVRKTNSQQKGSDAKTRKIQAKEAFDIAENIKINPENTYILFDDIKTTGSTLDETSRILNKAGAKNIWILYILKQVNF